jgi:hypothetical protein
MAYQYKMKLLRNNEVEKRRKAIQKIQDKKDAAIADLVAKHEIKYEQIKAYYTEITNTNLDVIRTLQ